MLRTNIVAAALICQIGLAVTVSTASYNNARTNANTSETAFTHAGAGKIGWIGTFAVDGYVYGQPLIIDSVSIGGATRVLLVATMHNSIYLFNADVPGSAELWKVNVGTPLTSFINNDQFNYGTEVGCWATPVVDVAAAVVYATCVSNTGVWKLYALNLADGTTFHAEATFSGTNNGVTFDSVRHMQRTALLLHDGNVYAAFCGWADQMPYQGWVFAYDKTTLAQAALWSAVDNVGTPSGSYAYNCVSNCGAAGIWMGSGGLASDGTNIYLMTGNGDWNGTTNFGESFVKLNSALAVQSFGTPSDYATLNSADTDLGSGRVILASTFVMGGGKDGKWWLMNQADLGGLQGVGAGPVQVWTAKGHGIFGGEAFANNTLFLAASSDTISSFAFGGATFTTTATASTASSFSFPGAAITYSSNGATAGTDILWATTVSASAGSLPRQGRLRAFNATTLVEIYNSGETIGIFSKFGSPTVANGKVYVPTFSNSVAVFGMLGTKAQGVTFGGGITLK